jgi:segregation and condensation protein A
LRAPQVAGSISDIESSPDTPRSERDLASGSLMDQDRVLARVGEFPVDLPIFRGPFRVLADLILEREVDVCDVPVARVTEDFLARAEDAEGWTLEEATWFLAICSVLLELKVGRLFPARQDADEEDLVGGSPDLAYARSLELAAFRRVAVTLAAMIEAGSRFVPREAGPAEEFAHLYPDPMAKATPQALAETAAGLLRRPSVDLSHVAPIRASVTEAVERLEGRLSRRGEARFRDLVRDCRERIQVVVRFLALLELHARGRVALRQAETFGDIQVRWAG